MDIEFDRCQMIFMFRTRNFLQEWNDKKIRAIAYNGPQYYSLQSLQDSLLIFESMPNTNNSSQNVIKRIDFIFGDAQMGNVHYYLVKYQNESFFNYEWITTLETCSKGILMVIKFLRKPGKIWKLNQYFIDERIIKKHLFDYYLKSGQSQCKKKKIVEDEIRNQIQTLKDKFHKKLVIKHSLRVKRGIQLNKDDSGGKQGKDVFEMLQRLKQEKMCQLLKKLLKNQQQQVTIGYRANKIIGKALFQGKKVYLMRMLGSDRIMHQKWIHFITRNDRKNQLIKKFNFIYKDKTLPFFVAQYRQRADYFMNELNSINIYPVETLIAKAKINGRAYYLAKLEHKTIQQSQWINSSSNGLNFRWFFTKCHEFNQQFRLKIIDTFFFDEQSILNLLSKETSPQSDKKRIHFDNEFNHEQSIEQKLKHQVKAQQGFQSDQYQNEELFSDQQCQQCNSSSIKSSQVTSSEQQFDIKIEQPEQYSTIKQSKVKIEQPEPFPSKKQSKVIKKRQKDNNCAKTMIKSKKNTNKLSKNDKRKISFSSDDRFDYSQESINFSEKSDQSDESDELFDWVKQEWKKDTDF